MAIEGYIDTFNSREISGWAFEDAYPNSPLRVEIFESGKIISVLLADMFREDLLAAGKGNGQHAFRFTRASDGPPLSARIVGKRWNLQPTSGLGVAAIHHDPRRRMQHTLEFGFPNVTTAFSTAIANASELASVDRIITSFHRVVADNSHCDDDKTDLWSSIDQIYHQEIKELLYRRDVRGTAEYLRNAHARGLTFGITQGIETTETLRNDPSARRMVATEYVDNLVSLAEFLGVLNVESPSQKGQWAENMHCDLDELVERISSHIGVPLQTPPVMDSYFGCFLHGGIVTGRDICALYAAIRLRDIMQDAGVQNPHALEIGGGLGGGAYYATRLGLRYTIVDLPLIGVLQAYFLIHALPNVKIRLYGEPEVLDAQIELLPAHAFAQRRGNWDILLNQDSFPEINEKIVLDYLREAKKSVRHAFLSINQEARAPQSDNAAQGVVRDFFAQVGGFRRVMRARHWLRAGYVEELYKRC
jgi:hypothetical protein